MYSHDTANNGVCDFIVEVLALKDDPIVAVLTVECPRNTGEESVMLFVPCVVWCCAGVRAIM